MIQPLARSDDLVVEPLGEELLVFDSKTNRAHSLNAAAASVWRACDGARDVDALAQYCELDPVAVELALDSLRKCELLIDFQGPRVSRRQALRKAAVVGAGIGVALPVIRSIYAPSAYAATSIHGCTLTAGQSRPTAPQPCKTQADCCARKSPNYATNCFASGPAAKSYARGTKSTEKVRCNYTGPNAGYCFGKWYSAVHDQPMCYT
jgi:hypothetical protein